MKISNIEYFNYKYKERGNFEEGKPLIDYIGKSDEGGFYSHPLINNIQGVYWEYNNIEGDLREVEIFEKEKTLFAYPSPDMKYMVVLFNRDSDYYPHPNNLVVFYPNGKVKQVIKVPKLISEKAIKNANNPFGEHKEGGFENVRWHKTGNKKVMVIDIYFAWENTETREFDPETGEFGELIGVFGKMLTPRGLSA